MQRDGWNVKLVKKDQVAKKLFRFELLHPSLLLKSQGLSGNIVENR